LSTSLTHITAREIPVRQWPSKAQNGILHSFVANSKKYLILKRGFDILFAILAILLVMSWLVPLTALLIKITSPGPVFFLQKRVGKNGKLFYCIKFRTMVRNNEADERPAESNDGRVTSIGRFLRRTNVDELPQFFNVLAGQMSVVGPRPHMVADCNRFSFVIPSYQFRSILKPGITGYAQVNGYHGPTSDYESIIIRYYWDAQYVRRASTWLDLKIIGLTITQFLRNIKNALFYSPSSNDVNVRMVKR
jgi:putative colanic acid biosynthesis UDP-glucose lipid carrier transferase